MAARKWLKRIVTGPLAVLWMHFLAQYIWHRQNVEPMDRVTGSAVNVFAHLVAFLEYPTSEIADMGAAGLSAIVLALSFGKQALQVGILRRLETYGCTIHETVHHGPGSNMTYDVRADGRLCNNQGRQILAIMHHLGSHMSSIDKDHCYVMCWDVVPADDARLHGFVTSVPAYQVPSRKLCPNTKGFLGRCLRDGEESPARAP